MTSKMTTEHIMHLVYDYADAYHNRVDSIGEVDSATLKEMKRTQMAIAAKIREAIAAEHAANDVEPVAYLVGLGDNKALDANMEEPQ